MLTDCVENTASLCHGMSVRGLPESRILRKIPFDLLFEIANVDFETQLTLVYAIPALWRRYQADSAWRNKFVERELTHTAGECKYCDKYCSGYHYRYGVRIRGSFYFHHPDGPVIHNIEKQVPYEIWHKINLPELQKIVHAAQHSYTNSWKLSSELGGCYTAIANYISELIEHYVGKITYNNTDLWIKDGKLHRVGGPAVINCFRQEWWQNGKRHRLDGPALITRTETSWYKNGELHREDGPAYTDLHREKWYKNGNIHRLYGPAVRAICSDECKICDNDRVEYWIGGERVSAKRHSHILALSKRAGIEW